MSKLTLADLDVAGKRVLVRVDFNVPLGDDGEVSNDARIRASVPTIQAILERGGIPVLMTHLGRPKGKVVDAMRLDPVARRLSELLDRKVKKADDCVGPAVEKLVKKAQKGEVVLLENLRFHKEEEENEPGFAAALAKLGELYVNDAFGTSHRAHASIVGPAAVMPAAAGLLLEKEIDSFERALTKPERPFVAILGGAKVSDKILVIENLLEKVDALLIGGGMTYTFLAAQGLKIGASLVEKDRFEVAKKILAKAKAKKVRLELPVDHVIADRFADDAECKTIEGAIPDEWMALDIGPKTRALFAGVIAGAKTIIWNGPMGVFEMAPFAAGTEAVARAVADAQALSIVGGGDSVAAVEQFGLESRISHISTGGGASLELLEGQVLPGIAALTDRQG
ncbi:MAG: phosphoglycerate kinase [Planctomycetes bacterium]|nr:phosphoglycerate kinase [Planctomycetota bacterium]